jgi:hypothetical protein
MSKPLVGRRGTERVILWGRVGMRALDAAIVVLVPFLIVTCAVGASHDGAFFDTWWGRHLLTLLAGFLALAVAGAAGWPLWRRLRLPLEQLPELDSASGGVAAEDRAERRLVRRRLIPVAGVALVVVLVAGFYLEENERGERAWNRYQRQQEALGERLDPAALVPSPVPDEQNFAATPSLAPLFDFLPGSEQSRNPSAVAALQAISPRYEAAAGHADLRRLPRSNSWVIAEIDLPGWHTASLKGTNAADSGPERFRARYGLAGQPPGATPAQPPAAALPLATNRTEAAAGLLAALADADPLLEQLRVASLRPYSRFNLCYTNDNPATILLPHLATLKRLCQILQLRAAAELALGQNDQGFEDVSLIFRLADAIRNEPLLICQLVRISELQIALQPLAEGLARHQWSEPQLVAFEQRLLQLDFCADGRRALEGQRAFLGCGLIDWVRRSPHRYLALTGMGSGTPGTGQSSFDWQSALLAAVPSGWFCLEKLNFCRLIQDDFLPAFDVPARRFNPDVCAQADSHFESLHASGGMLMLSRHESFAALLLPGLTRAAQKFAFAQAGTDAAAVACALERYRLARGQFPDSLNALVPDFISRLPHDVIDGQPLKYRRTPDRLYLLYSVGWNKTDDGGIIGLREKGVAVDQTVGDWVWRLPAQ